MCFQTASYGVPKKIAQEYRCELWVGKGWFLIKQLVIVCRGKLDGFPSLSNVKGCGLQITLYIGETRLVHAFIQISKKQKMRATTCSMATNFYGDSNHHLLPIDCGLCPVTRLFLQHLHCPCFLPCLNRSKARPNNRWNALMPEPHPRRGE